MSRNLALFLLGCSFVARAATPLPTDPLTYEQFKAMAGKMLEATANDFKKKFPTVPLGTPSATGYGTLQKRQQLISERLNLVNSKKPEEIDRTAVKQKFKDLFVINNEAYLNALGLPVTADNRKRIASLWISFWEAEVVKAQAALNADTEGSATYCTNQKNLIQAEEALAATKELAGVVP